MSYMHPKENKCVKNKCRGILQNAIVYNIYICINGVLVIVPRKASLGTLYVD